MAPFPTPSVKAKWGAYSSTLARHLRRHPLPYPLPCQNGIRGDATESEDFHFCQVITHSPPPHVGVNRGHVGILDFHPYPAVMRQPYLPSYNGNRGDWAEVKTFTAIQQS